jgi:hypothetical protein
MDDTSDTKLLILRRVGGTDLWGLLLARGAGLAAKRHPTIPVQRDEKKETSAGAGASCAACEADNTNQTVMRPAVSQQEKRGIITLECFLNGREKMPPEKFKVAIPDIN